MAKNTSYVSHFTVDEMVKVISDYTEAKFLNDLLAAGDFSLLTDESTNETGRAQLSIFVCYVDLFTNESKEEFVCIRKFGTSKTSKALMNELEQMFIDKNIDKMLIRFSGLNGRNTMSGAKKGLQRCICHVFPYVLYMNCRYHHLALCLVHLLKQYNKLESVDALLSFIWNIFHYSSIKQAVFANAQETKNMLLKILKSCTTQWLMHGKTSIHVITWFKPLVAALDAIYKDKNDL